MAGTDPSNRAAVLENLPASVAKLERGSAPPEASVVRVCPTIDRALPGGGLARGALHEALIADRGAAVGLCAQLLARGNFDPNRV